jgi:hypothetical protein
LNLHPLQIDDMSPAEMLACHLLPEELRPAGLPTEAAIWAEYKARRTPKPPGAKEAIEKAKRETCGR